MSEQIKVGDLVRVYRTCCAFTTDTSYGKIGIIKSIRTVWWRCPVCGAAEISEKALAFNGRFDSAPLSWLKKIDPPAAPEGGETESEVTA